MDRMYASAVPPVDACSQISTVRFLERLPLFQELDSERITRLARSALETALPLGSIVFRQGDVPSGFYIVARGLVKLSLQTARGDEKVIELLGCGMSFGAVPLFLGEQHSLTAETIADSVLVHMGKNAVLEELERNSRFASRMLRDVCHRLQQRTRDFENCVALNGTQRVTTYLLSQIPHGVNGKSIAVMLPAKKGIIASRLNLTHEHFSRILHEIQAARLIEVRGREIQVFNVARLRAYAA
jgi:CRP-like cAMP-binding protein